MSNEDIKKDGHVHSEDCGCGHDHETEELRMMKVVLEDGTEESFGVIDIFEVKNYPGKQYIALVTPDGEQVYLYEYIEKGGGEVSLENIGPDEEFDAVAEVFESNIVEDGEDE